MAVIEHDPGERFCVRLTEQEMNAFVLLGWTLHSGPYLTPEACGVVCNPISPPPPPPGTGSDAITTLCCPGVPIPTTLYADITGLCYSSGSFHSVEDLGITLPIVEPAVYGPSPNPGLLSSPGWVIIKTVEGGARYGIILWCNGTGFQVNLLPIDGGAIFGASNGADVSPSCFPFSASVSISTDGCLSEWTYTS